MWASSTRRPSDAAVVMTSGTTAALNLVARGLERELRPGDEILDAIRTARIVLG